MCEFEAQKQSQQVKGGCVRAVWEQVSQKPWGGGETRARGPNRRRRAEMYTSVMSLVN